jgi:hypothetical protein
VVLIRIALRASVSCVHGDDHQNNDQNLEIVVTRQTAAKATVEVLIVLDAGFARGNAIPARKTLWIADDNPLSWSQSTQIARRQL